ncbi:MAG: hypothetical protein HMLKMBBP_00015 [Planctomycetes bacterium]|nr:hypothetical protein [Planctomycetota bacterium]
MQDPFDPDAMTPEQRERELSALLATGYLRHRALRAPGAASTCVPRPDDGDRQREKEVDGVAEQSVHVPHADGSAPPAEQEAR